MVRNSIWLTFLTIGAIISTSVTSCSKIDDPARFAEFYFVNNTDHSITFEYSSSSSNQERMGKYKIAPKSTTIIKQTQESNKSVAALDFFTPFVTEYGFTEPLIIKFNNIRCLKASSASQHSPLDIKNYISEKLDDRKYKFTYTFSEADYSKAEMCP